MKGFPIILGIAFSISLITGFMLSDSFAAKPDSNEWVYLVKSQNPVLKSQLGVRHNFDLGFTTTLNENQVKGLQKAGFELESVPVYHFAKPPGSCSPWPECKNGGGSDTTRQTPSDQTPWGIEKIYNNVGIVSTSGGNNVKVAVLDSGVQREHPDLKNRVIDCKDFTKGSTPKNNCKDDDGHGTHVSGTILADGGSDGLGIYGISPGAQLMALKVCNSLCWSDDIAAAIDYAGSNGANIISMSLGGDSESSLVRNAIARNPQILFVAAAGNDGPAIGSIDYPGANPSVIAVGAIDVNEQVPSWSSRGINNGDGIIELREVEFGAPGVGIESTWNNGGYNTISGTSMATPHISGLAAKFWQGNAQDTRVHLQSLANDIWYPGDDTATGLGLPKVP